ncbi:MAG: AEC family transporter [Zoogloeaceae bacterium]|jgi:predicted permease|nr:AEC family transporter [Zoogloeaceae bacterium]
MALDAFLLILSMLATGYLFARLKLLPENAADTLNRVVLYLCLPASVLLYLPRLHPDWKLSGLMLIPWALAGFVFLLLSLLKKPCGWRRDEYAALLLCVMLGNTGFVGYPMIRALLGEAALGYAVIYDQFGTFLLLTSVGLYLCAHFGGDAMPGFKTMILRILRFPPALALIAGLTVMPLDPPEWIRHTLTSLSDAMLPLVMLAVGFSLRFTLPMAELRALTAGLAVKLLVMPLVAWGMAWALGLHGDLLRVAVLESAMPAMITAAVLAIAHNLAPRLAAALTGYGILCAMLTLPFWNWALTGV